MQPYHITIATLGRTTLFPEPDALRRAVCALARVTGEQLLLFSIADDHLHVVVATDREGARQAASSVNRLLGGAGAPPRGSAYIVEVSGRAHLKRLVGYATRQVAKHGLADHPAVWPGSCAPDLLGVRVLAGFDAGRIDRALPRASVRDEVIAACGVWRPALRPASDEVLAQLEPEALLDVALRACAADRSREPASVIARAAFVQLCARPSAEVASATGIPERTVRALRQRDVPAHVLGVIRRRVTLERWVATVPTSY